MSSYDEAKLLCTTLRLYAKKFTNKDDIDDVIISPFEWGDDFFVITIKDRESSMQSSQIYVDVLEELIKGFVADEYVLKGDVPVSIPLVLYFEKIS